MDMHKSTRSLSADDLHVAYRDMYIHACGAECGLPAANDALKSAMIGRLRMHIEFHFGTRVGDVLPIEAGAAVLVWPRGRDHEGLRYVAWHPSMKIDQLLHLGADALEVLEKAA